ncbi:MAG: DNA-binding response regulator [Calditrichaeota bacterium]|nr:MAG: DNA-binding response regulator [Calditrichota bacterium]
MKILIAEDDNASRQLLKLILQNDGYDVIEAVDGAAALRLLEKHADIEIAILDWLMPAHDGTEVCRLLRADEKYNGVYLILLTVQSKRENLLEGLNSGADDYVMKPYDKEVLLARIKVGIRTVSLRHALADRVIELEKAFAQVKKLQGLLPICSYCKKIRNDSNYWQQLEDYISVHSDAQFSHGICPDCFSRHVEKEM